MIIKIGTRCWYYYCRLMLGHFILIQIKDGDHQNYVDAFQAHIKDRLKEKLNNGQEYFSFSHLKVRGVFVLCDVLYEWRSCRFRCNLCPFSRWIIEFWMFLVNFVYSCNHSTSHWQYRRRHHRPQSIFCRTFEGQPIIGSHTRWPRAIFRQVCNCC